MNTTKSKGNVNASAAMTRCSLVALLSLVLMACNSTSAPGELVGEATPADQKTNVTNAVAKDAAPVSDLHYYNVNVTAFEKSMTLYREILGFDLTDAQVLDGQLAEVLVLTLQANDAIVRLHIPPKIASVDLSQSNIVFDTEFTLVADDLVLVATRLIANGYSLEVSTASSEIDEKKQYFTGPNGEVIHLSN